MKNDFQAKPAAAAELEGNKLSGIKTFIFDCGRVITCDQDPTAAASMARILGAPIQDFTRVYHAERSAYDRGTMGAAEYWARVGEHFGFHPDAETLEKLVELDMDSWFTINPETISVVRELKSLGYRVIMLSNMNLEGKIRMFGPSRYLAGEDWLSLFDDVLLSCDLKMIKPEENIYKACVSRALADASECLFIDDIEVNLEGAKRCGINTHLFTDAGLLRDTLGEVLAGKWRNR